MKHTKRLLTLAGIFTLTLFTIAGITSAQTNRSRSLQYFTEIQAIPTTGAADWHAFTMDNEHYLAVGYLHDGVTYNLDSYIYRWNGTEFTLVQTVPTHGVEDWEFFTIDNQHYLALTNYYNDTTRNINSDIYRWDGSAFTIFQHIPTHGARDWEFFTIDNEHYLAVVNHSNDVDAVINSHIYRWNGTSFDLTPYQSILTYGGQDWEFFTIGNEHYLAIANRVDGNSYIYQWEVNASFIPIQTIPIDSAADWEAFTIDGEHYLAVANYWQGHPNYNIDSYIYRWDGTKFSLVQSIPTNGIFDWEFFSIRNKSYLIAANRYNGSTYNIDSHLYQWDGTEFTLFQSIPTNNGNDWEFFTIGSNHYLAVANGQDGSTYDVDSKIYQAVIEGAGNIFLPFLHTP